MAILPDHPQPLFDTIASLDDRLAPVPDYMGADDYEISREFLLAYRHSPDTFHSYRREVDRFLNWVYLVAMRDLTGVDRQDIENYVRFCQRPPRSWVAKKMVAKFLERDGHLVPNSEWRPYVAKVSKANHKLGKNPSAKRYRLSDSGLQAMLRILSTFYTFLEMEEHVVSNPVKRLRQRSRLVRTQQRQAPVRRLSELQWDYLVETAQQMAEANPSHERTLFIVSALYGLYLRISEIADTDTWTPLMNHFFKDADGNWWFKTVGKGNKERDITVSQDMLRALKRYRKSLGLPALPSPPENVPLVPKQRGQGGLASTRQLRDIVQGCFDRAIERLRLDELAEEAEALEAATVHWLRHTGISDDVKIRPREHVRDDAGHSSSVTTDRYIDIEKRERHASARRKKLRPID